MKKRYIKPQIKAFAVRPQNLLKGSIITNNKIGSIHMDSREVSFFDDDEDEEEESAW